MKKIVLLCMLTGILFSIYGQAKKEPAVVTKNKLEAGAFFAYDFNTAEVPESTIDFTIPYAKYYYETVQKETNKFFLSGDFGYNMTKTTYDGEALEGQDCFGSRMFLNIEPQLRMYLKKEMFGQKNKPGVKNEEEEWNDEEGTEEVKKDRWFVAAGLPVSYEMFTPQVEDADAVTSTFVDVTLDIGYDDNNVDVKKLSPWAKFEEGIFGYAFFDYRVVETYYDTDSETKPVALGAYGQYAYDSGNYLPNSMLKVFMSLKYQMAEEAVRFLPMTPSLTTPYYTGKSFDLKYGFEIAADFTEQLNAYLKLEYLTIQLLDSPNSDSQNFLGMLGRVNFYPIPELALWGGMDWTGFLPEELDYIPEFNFTFGAAYTFDFLQMKNSPAKKSKKAAEDEEGEDEVEPEDEEDW